MSKEKITSYTEPNDNNKTNSKKDQSKSGYEFLSDFLNSLMDSYDSLKKQQANSRAALEKSYKHVGRIISCHLIIENLINIELVALNKYSHDKLRSKNGPSFAAKLSQLPTKGYIYVFLLSGIKQLNVIRNAFAHNLEVEITEKQTLQIDKVVRLFRKEKVRTMSLEKRIEEFTILCIGAFGTRNENVRKPFLDLRAKYPELDEILKKTSEEND